MKKLYTRFFMVTLAMMIFAADGFGQKTILFVGRDSPGYYQSDTDLFDSLTAWGYVPEFAASKAEYALRTVNFNPLDYGNYEGMFICETVDSKAMAIFASDGYPLPSVNLEGYAVAAGNDRWAWLNDNGTELIQTGDAAGSADDQILVIKDNTHYITEVFDVGNEIPWSTVTEPTVLASVRPVSIKEVNQAFSAKLGQMKSHAGEADFWNFVTVDAIGPSDNKLVYWGLHHAGLDGIDEPSAADSNFGTPEFFTLIKRSCEWAYGDTGGSTSIREHSRSFGLTAYPNPASGRLTVQFSAESEINSTATLYNVAGQQVDIFNKVTVEGRNFMYLDAAKYPAGIYQLHLDLNGVSAVTKVVIQ